MTDPITIRCRENGPLVVHGPFRLVDHTGKEIALPTDKPLVALCRCGQSGNKPFCDGSHKGCGFVGESGEVGGGPTPPPNPSPKGEGEPEAKGRRHAIGRAPAPPPF